MDKFIVNIIHRPEMVPEYSATVTGQGKEEDIGDKALLTESLDIFKTQQRLAHENGLKVTIQMTYASLFNDEAVEIAKHDHEVELLVIKGQRHAMDYGKDYLDESLDYLRQRIKRQK